jgi:hypothetical protein
LIEESKKKKMTPPADEVKVHLKEAKQALKDGDSQGALRAARVSLIQSLYVGCRM